MRQLAFTCVERRERARPRPGLPPIWRTPRRVELGYIASA